MHVIKQYPDGYFCWIDLTTIDTEAAKAFYAGLFGWEFLDIPMPEMDSVYSMAHFDNNLIAGLGPQSPDMQGQGVPPMWSSYIKHDDVDAISARVTEAGGTLIMPPMDVLESGRMIMAVDPTGAMFGVWQPNQHAGANLVNQPNTLCWNELQTHDVVKAKEFYTKVFGWGSQTEESGYVTFQVDDRTQAGSMKIQEEWGEVPPNWTVYFLVEDVNAAAEKVAELGGVIDAPPMRIGEMGEMAIAQDPQGGHFTLIEYDAPGEVPPFAEVV